MSRKEPGSMRVMDRIVGSRPFYAWRCVYAVAQLAWTIPFFIVHSLDWSVDVAYYNLFIGVLPSLVFLVLRYSRLHLAWRIAYIYDVFLFFTMVAGLIWLPNYMGLLFVLPSAGFVIEGVLLTLVLMRDRESGGLVPQEQPPVG